MKDSRDCRSTQLVLLPVFTGFVSCNPVPRDDLGEAQHGTGCNSGSDSRLIACMGGGSYRLQTNRKRTSSTLAVLVGSRKPQIYQPRQRRQLSIMTAVRTWGWSMSGWVGKTGLYRRASRSLPIAAFCCPRGLLAWARPRALLPALGGLRIRHLDNSLNLLSTTVVNVAVRQKQGWPDPDIR